MDLGASYDCIQNKIPVKHNNSTLVMKGKFPSLAMFYRLLDFSFSMCGLPYLEVFNCLH